MKLEPRALQSLLQITKKTQIVEKEVYKVTMLKKFVQNLKGKKVRYFSLSKIHFKLFHSNL